LICIIPARKGSKGLKNKNIKKISNKPLISYTIDHALSSKIITNIIINSNDDRVLSIAKKYNSKKIIIYKRNDELAKSNSSAIDVYLDCINKLNKRLISKIKNFCVLLPTSPLRNPRDIDESIKLFFKKKAKVVISVSENKPIEYLFKLNKNNKIIRYKNIENSVKNRQDLNSSYNGNGSIYVLNFKSLQKTKSYYTDRSFGYITLPENSIDIDNYKDFKFAKKIMI
tara:strand:- start:174 stop:854 length:681 start_codon:yes stop_codon:yes gene_type:complete